MNVFISFAKQDKNRVARLAETMRHGGGRDWRYVYDLYGARDWQSEIQYNIDHCEVFLFVITEHSLSSEWCLKELQHAALIQKPIVTVVFTTGIDIPHPLNTIQYVLYDESPASGAKLIRAITDPRPLGQDKIPPNWERLGGGPLNALSPRHDVSRSIPIPKLKRELTDMEKEDYLYESIGEIKRYFCQALAEFERSDTQIETRLREESNTAFTCHIFLNGMIRKSCMIWVSNQAGMNGIAYHEANGQLASYGMNSYNAIARVAEKDGKPALEFTFGLAMFSQQDDCRVCTVERACECLWKYFTEEFNQVSSFSW